MVKLTESIICGRTKVSALEMVRKLNCWGCDLDDIEILQQMPNVEVLSLSVNNIDTLWPLAGCTNLRELYLRKNNINDLCELRHLRRLSNLRILWLSENPCTDHPDYRLYVLNKLPSLTTLDNRPVTMEELNAAASYDQSNGDAPEDGMTGRVSESSPECDMPTPEFVDPNRSNGWQTAPAHRQMGNGIRRSVEADRCSNGYERSPGMSTSCYAPAETNGFTTAPVARQNAWTSMNSLQDAPQNGFVYERAVWQSSPQQQPRCNTYRRSTSNTNPNNILSAILTLFNELDRRGLETVINEAEQRLQRM